MAMLEGLVSGEREAQILSAREIANLSKKQKQKLSDDDNIGVLVISSLVAMIHRHQHDHEPVEASLLALLNLAFGSERNKNRMVKCGAVPAILKTLRCGDDLVLELSIAALLILSSCSANKREIASCGAIGLLLELLMNSNYCSAQAKFDIISTLHNLSTCSEIIPSIVASDGLVVLVQLIYESPEKSSELVEKAMALLESIVSSSNEALNQVSEMEGAIGVLVEAIEEASPTCQEHAAAILEAVCRSCRERYRGMILKEGAVPGLLQLSVGGTWRARENAKALLLLLRDCGGSTSSAEKVKCKKKNVKLREVMREIDRWEVVGRGGASVKVVEEMISKLRT